jgi:hypothetical protein
MYFKSLSQTGVKIDRYLLVVFIAFCVSCDASNESPAPFSPPAASPAQTPRALLTLSRDNGFAGVVDVGNTKISLTPQGLVVQALTADPAIGLPRQAVTGQTPLKVRIQFVSPGPSVSQVFYDTKAQPDHWDERHSIRKPTAKGENNITVDIPDPEFGGRIRFDPGDLEGEYIIMRIEVRP